MRSQNSTNKTFPLVCKPFAEKNDAQAPYTEVQFQDQSSIVTNSHRVLMYFAYGLTVTLVYRNQNIVQPKNDSSNCFWPGNVWCPNSICLFCLYCQKQLRTKVDAPTT